MMMVQKPHVMILACREKEVIICKSDSNPLQRILTEIVSTVNAALKKEEAVAAY